MSSQSKTVRYLCKEEADLRFSFVNISNESKQLFLLRSFHSHPRFSRSPFPLCDSQKKKKKPLSKINKSKLICINRSKYITCTISHHFLISFFRSIFRIIFYPKIKHIRTSRSIRKKVSERVKIRSFLFAGGMKLTPAPRFLRSMDR